MAWRGMGGACHHGMVQDWLPAFQNDNALVSVDELEISEGGCVEPLWWAVWSLGPARWFPSTVLGDAVPMCALLWPTSVSPHLVAALCSFMWVSRALFVSHIYIHGRNLVHNSSRSWFLILISCLWRVDANQNSKSKIILPNPFNSTPSALVYIVNVVIIL